jgi:hypothetical protein
MNKIPHVLDSEAPASSIEVELQVEIGAACSAAADRVWRETPDSGSGVPRSGQSLLCRLLPADPHIRRSLFRR